MEENKTQRPKSKKFLLVYSISLLVFAGIVIAFSFLGQARVSEQEQLALDAQKQLNEKQELADELTSQVTTLSKEVYDMKNTDIPKLEGKVAANEYIWKMLVAPDKASLDALLKEFNEKQLTEYLTDEAKALLPQIQNKFEVKENA